MNIAFSGHRDKSVDVSRLEQIRVQYPSATWVHGGAVGFDTQVETFAKAHGIATIIHLPDYRTHGRAAPFVRNRTIVESSTLLIALYDGRKTGGTLDAIKTARKLKIPVTILVPV